ncbi:alpha/beta hydrolase [Nitriliruptoraceae bacterium ZYF776]|nr:alpha/beta hydrolase [Profundirhabdus halotolerans]
MSVASDRPSGVSWPVRLHTHAWNPLATGPRALLLHGLGSDGATWWRLASQLADEGWSVLAPDLRGHGRSPAAVDHRIATLARDVALLGAAYDLVVGHSLGGAVAATLLADAEVEIRGAVLVDPVLRLAADDRERLRVEQRADVGRLAADEVAAANPRWDPRDVDRKVLAAAQVAPSVVDAVVDHNDPWDVAGSAGAWTARVHLLAADPAVGSLLAPALLDQLVDGDRVTGEVVPGAGHAIHRDDPATVAAAVGAVVGAGRSTLGH